MQPINNLEGNFYGSQPITQNDQILPSGLDVLANVVLDLLNDRFLLPIPENAIPLRDRSLRPIHTASQEPLNQEVSCFQQQMNPPSPHRLRDRSPRSTPSPWLPRASSSRKQTNSPLPKGCLKRKNEATLAPSETNQTDQIGQTDQISQIGQKRYRPFTNDKRAKKLETTIGQLPEEYRNMNQEEKMRTAFSKIKEEIQTRPLNEKTKNLMNRYLEALELRARNNNALKVRKDPDLQSNTELLCEEFRQEMLEGEKIIYLTDQTQTVINQTLWEMIENRLLNAPIIFLPNQLGIEYPTILTSSNDTSSTLEAKIRQTIRQRLEITTDLSQHRLITQREEKLSRLWIAYIDRIVTDVQKETRNDSPNLDEIAKKLLFSQLIVQLDRIEVITSTALNLEERLESIITLLLPNIYYIEAN